MTNTDPLPIDSLRVAATLSLLARALDYRVRQDSTDGLGITETSLLRQVEHGFALPSQVARVMRLDPGRVTRLIDRLVDLGYLEREADLEDRRRCKLLLTMAGRDRLFEGRTDAARVMDMLLAAMKGSDRLHLATSLEAARRALDATVVQPPDGIEP